MHRLHTATTAAQATSQVRVDTAHGPARLSFVESEAPVSLFAPVHYEENYAYPLIVWLHGHASNERHLMRIMPHINLRNYVACAPRGTVPLLEGAKDTRYTWAQTPEEISAADRAVEEAIASATDRFNISSRRIFLCGFGSGGSMALRLALRQPKRFAGVASVDGPLPLGLGLFAKLQAVRKFPVWLACGRESLECPTSTVCNMLRLLHAAGVHLNLRQYPGPHDLSPLMLEDLNRWLMEQVTGQPSC